MLQKYYLFGHNLHKSFSPAIHNLCFRELNLLSTHCYEAKQLETLEEYNRILKSKDFGGASVGSPFKKCFEHLPKLGISNRLSNINTIVKQQGYLVAYNTDYAGIANCLDKYTKIKTALVIGAGSTSQTFCQYLEKREIEILLVNRSMQRLYQMPAQLKNIKKFPLGWLSNPTHDPDLIINAVPQSATIHISPLLFRKKPIIMDVNYRPKITDFIQNGIDNGCSDFVYGIDLLIAQCLEQNYIFTGKRVDQERAREVLRKEYQQQEVSRSEQFQ